MTVSGIVSATTWPAILLHAIDSAEFASNGTIYRRYVRGPQVDEGLIWYEGRGTSDRQLMHADERDLIAAVNGNVGNCGAGRE